MAIETVTLPGAGSKIAVDTFDTDKQAQVIKIGLGGDGETPVLVDSGQQTAANSLPVIPASDWALPAGSNVIGQVFGAQVTASTDVTRPADTAAYAVADAIANSTSSPTSGGFTLSGMARQSGGSGILTDLLVISSAAPGTPLQLEVWIFDQAVTAINDNAAFSVSDSDIKNLVAIVPLSLRTIGANSQAHAQNLSIGYTCVGSANLRYLLQARNAYTPASGEVITVRAKAVQTT
jgi:hypothetical protein